MGEDALSGWREGWISVLGGGVACWFGLTWGAVIARGTWLWKASLAEWSVGGVATWFAVFLRSLGWGYGLGGVGWILLSVAAVLGATRWEWSRLAVAGGVAIATGLAGMRAWPQGNSCGLAEHACGSVPPAAWWQLGVAALLVLLGTAQRHAWCERAFRKMRKRGAPRASEMP